MLLDLYLHHPAFPSTIRQPQPDLPNTFSTHPTFLYTSQPLNPTTETYKKPPQKPQIHQAPLCTAPIPFPRFPPATSRPLSLHPLPLPWSAETRIIPPCTYTPFYRPGDRCLVRQRTGALGLGDAAKGVDRALERWAQDWMAGLGLGMVGRLGWRVVKLEFGLRRDGGDLPQRAQT